MGMEIEINTEMLASDIEQLQENLKSIEDNLNEMYEAVHHLDNMWDGPANQAFNTQFNHDRSDMTELCNTIQKIINCMDYAKKEYNSCEADVSSIIASISI